ncbi:hypothetical protein D3C72_1220630 [compost metagenome]
MPVDVGDELQGAARTIAPAGVGGQPHAPIAAADPDVDDGLPFALRVGILDEVAHAPMFSRDGFDRLRRAQHGVPGGAVLGHVDVLAGQQRLAGRIEAAGVQEVFGRQPGGGRIDLRAEVDGEAGGMHEAKRIGAERGFQDSFGICLPFGQVRQARVVDGIERMHIFENTS